MSQTSELIMHIATFHYRWYCNPVKGNSSIVYLFGNCLDTLKRERMGEISTVDNSVIMALISREQESKTLLMMLICVHV